MKIGIPREIKDKEARVALIPDSVAKLSTNHKLYIEKDAGSLIGFSDEQYINAGAEIIADKKALYKNSDLIVKVKEPQASECELIQAGQMIFSYLHLAAEPELTKQLLNKKPIAFSFETLVDENGKLPLLKPMSEVAGRIAVQAAAFSLQRNNKGPGLLIGGVTGVKPLDVTILGGGIVGLNAAEMAVGLQGNVTILEKSPARIKELEDFFAGKLKIIESTKENIEKYVINCDVLIGSILLPGKSAPKLIRREMVKNMRKHAIFVDVAIDQGGCSETSRATSHSDPTYIIDDVIHYCVTNMPAAAARTATFALDNAIFPYVKLLADQGYKKLLQDNYAFQTSLNIYSDVITNQGVADSLTYDFKEISEIL